MELPIFQPPTPVDAAALWRVTTFGRQRTAAGRRYWWDNRVRTPPDMVVVQATLQGTITYRDAVETRIVGPGSLMVFSYDEDSAYGQADALTEPYRCHWINLQGAGLLEHITAFRQRHGSVRDVGLGHPLIAELDELIALADPQRVIKPTAMAAAVHTFILHLFDHAESHLMQRLSPVEQAIDHIVRQPYGPLTLDQIAARFGCSREHLGRAFRERTGQSPGAYLADARRRRALRLLRETDLPLSAVAEQSGFATVHTLARHIRRVTGVAPGALRSRRGGAT